MDTFQLSTKVTLVTKECPVCNIIYAIPDNKNSRCQETGERFYCPNGHVLIFTESEIIRLRHKLDQKEAELENTSQRLNGALQDISNKKRVITRMKNRVHNGVCMECHRHFENLERHMKTKHPEIVTE